MDIVRKAVLAGLLALFLPACTDISKERLPDPLTTGTLERSASTRGQSENEARRLVQDASSRISNLLRQRPADKRLDPDKTRLKSTIDQQIGTIEKERFAALQRVIQSQDGNILRADHASNIFLLSVRNHSGQKRWLSGNLLPIWHARGLDPDVLVLAATIGARPAVVNFAEGTKVDSKLLLAGTSSQAAVHPYPGDIDYAEEITVHAPNLEAAGEALANVVIEFVARTADDANLELDVLRIMPTPAKRQKNADYDWSESRILDPAEREELASQLVIVDGGRANSDWRALMSNGRYISIGKAFALYGTDSVNGGSLFKTQPLFIKYQQVYFGSAMPPATRQIPLGDYAYLMRHFALRYSKEGRYLKAAKRAFNYFRTIGDLDGMDAIKPVFVSKAARVSQQLKGLQAIATALEPERTSRILTVAGAREQIKAAARAIKADLAVVPGTLPGRPSGVADELQRIGEQIRGQTSGQSGLIKPDPTLAARIHALVDMEVKPIIRFTLKEPVELVIDEYIR